MSAVLPQNDDVAELCRRHSLVRGVQLVGFSGSTVTRVTDADGGRWVLKNSQVGASVADEHATLVVFAAAGLSPQMRHLEAGAFLMTDVGDRILRTSTSRSDITATAKLLDRLHQLDVRRRRPDGRDADRPRKRGRRRSGST